MKTELVALLQEIAGCQLCKNGAVNPLGPFVLPAVAPAPVLMIVGQSPGSDEVLSREPFTGAAGQLLNELLSTAGVERSRCWITNAVKCHPRGNRPLLDKEVRACAPYLQRELLAVQAPALLILGKDAWSSWEPIRERIPFKHGFLLTVTRPRILISRHPAYFLRNGQQSDFIGLASKLKELVHGPITV